MKTFTHTVIAQPKPEEGEWALHVRNEAAKRQFLSSGDYIKNASDVHRKINASMIKR